MPTDRRTLLRTVVATGTTAVLGGLAGCAGQDDAPEEGDGTPTDTPGEDDDTPDDSTGGDDPTETPDGDAAAVQVRDHENFGDVLVDAEGVTLYLFTQDEGGESACYDGCADNWPPLTVDGDPTAGDGVTADLGTTERDDGSTQVTAGEWPLYYFAGDENPGDANGQGLNDAWYVLAPDGSMIDGQGGGDDGDGSDGDGGSDDGDGSDDGSSDDGGDGPNY